MNLRRKVFAVLTLALVLGLGSSVFAQPVFENNTPRGFSPSDSTVTDTSITGREVSVLVDLNEAANFTYPVVGNFQRLERSVPYFSTGESAAYMSQAIAVDASGVIHRAWIQARGTVDIADVTTTPVYGVVYAKSFDGGKTFSDTVSVSGTLRFDLITSHQGNFDSGFSTVDIVVNSKGNPRVVYAMDMSADGANIAGADQTGRVLPGGGTSNVKSYDMIYFNYSNDGGSSWLPANSAVVISDTATVVDGGGGNEWPGRHVAFPRMAITSTDDIFIAYESGLYSEVDIQLAKVDEDSLKLGNAQQVLVGSEGTIGSLGGVRIDVEGDDGLGPDIAIGDDDVIHVVWYNYGAAGGQNVINHKMVDADLWSTVDTDGWDNTVDGATVATFDPLQPAIVEDEDAANDGAGNLAFNADAANRLHLFPSIAVDKARTPDRIYVLYKHATTFAASENIYLNVLDYNGQIGAPTGWGTASAVFPTATAMWATNGALFQNNTRFQVEQGWTFADRIAVAVDDRKGTTSDLHIVFSGGATAMITDNAGLGVISDATAGKLYYSRYNGTEWELPQVVATAADNDASGYPDGVYSKYLTLFEPDISMRSGDDNVYLTFVGGSPRDTGTKVAARAGAAAVAIGKSPGRGLAMATGASIAPLPFFKVIGREVTFDDQSLPKGANEYVLTYTPTNAQTNGLPLSYDGAGAYVGSPDMVIVTAGDNADGSGIGFSTPGASSAPGGFLTGQWRYVGTSLGVTSLNPTDSGAIYKGAVSQNQAQNDAGVFEGLVDDSGTQAFGEWGDDADKVGLLVKLNVLGSNSVDGGAAGQLGNIYVISASTASKYASAGTTTPDSSSQSISLAGYSSAMATVGTNTGASFVNGVTSETAVPTGITAAMGSYFQIGARIDIVATNVAPVLSIVEPNSSTISSGAFVNETASIRYTLYDSDDDFGTANTDLKAELYFYTDNGLSSVQDIQTFGTLIVDETDDSSVTPQPASGTGTDDFTEGASSSNAQTYTWDDPGSALQARGWAAVTKVPDGQVYIYIVADDGTNPPVFAVSDGAMRIRHIPIVRSVAPVAADTVDTGESTDLAKVNPYKIRFDLVDYDDNAQARLFYSTSSALTGSDVTLNGSYPFDIELAGASPIQLSDTLRTDEDIEFEFDVTAQGSSQDSIVAQGSYYIYAVIADGDTFAVAPSTNLLAVRHSPAFEFTAPLTGVIDKLNTTQQFKYTIQWQRGRSDVDVDGNALISLYYTGQDPTVVNYSGTDSTQLVATSGTNPGNAVLIAGGLREDDEGGNDQYIWDFRNPPGELPKVYLQEHVSGHYSANRYQSGTVTDTAWIYAVLHDSLGNTRVQTGGAVLLLGAQESPAAPAARVTMETPVAGGQTIVNGDVVRLEWDDFMIDDGTGTDDAYLRLYAAPRGKYTTLTQLESNNVGSPSGLGDVYVLNSLDGTTWASGSRVQDYTGASSLKIQRLRESDENYFLWDTKTTSFQLQGTPTELDIFIAASSDPRFGEDVYVNGTIDSVATGIGSRAQQAVLSKSPGALRVEFADPIYSIELGPTALSASSGDTLDFQVLVNSQNSSVDLMAFHLDVPRSYFEVIDQDAGTAGVQPFADSTGAFQSPSTIAQNDTTAGTDQFIKLNFVESIILGEVVGNASGDSSQVAATMQLKVKRFSAGAPLDTVLVWSNEFGRQTGLRRGTSFSAAPARDGQVKLTPRARILATVPLEGRPFDYSDTLDVHLREIGSTHDITDQSYIVANDVAPVFSGGTTAVPEVTYEDSVQVVSDNFGTFTLEEIPPGIYELTVKADGYVSGRSDTLNLFNGLIQNVDPTYGSDLLGNLSPATSLGELRGGDASGDNQVDIEDANFIFNIWNKTSADAEYVAAADINNDGVVNALDLGFVTSNFGNDGYGAPPVFKRSAAAGDNAAAMVELVGVAEVDAWWPGKVFEVTARVTDASDVMAYGLSMSYNPELVQPVGGDAAVAEGDIFASNPSGSLFLQRQVPGRIDVTAGRMGRDWTADGDANLVTVRFVTLTDDPGVIQVVGGELVNSAYQGFTMNVAAQVALPKVAALHENYPNPFNPSTEIRFDIPTARDVQLTVYNQLGQTIRTLVSEQMKAGTYRVQWDGTTQAGHKVSSGVYFYSLEAGDFTKIRKMTLVK